LPDMPEEKSTRPPSSGRLLSTQLLKPPFSEASLRSLIKSIPIQNISYSVSGDHQVNLDVLRTDLIDPKLGGNKLFKLWGYASDISRLAVKPDQIASFGGAYSNHLYALAALGEKLGLSTVGFIRGEKPKRLSATLRDLQSMGMALSFISRASYKRIGSHTFREELIKEHGIKGSVYWIPEGGRGEHGLRGCEILGATVQEFGHTHIAHACGTGTTLAGLCRGSQTSSASNDPRHRPVFIGISALRSDSSTAQFVLEHTQKALNPTSWVLSNQFHEGGFAKSNEPFEHFMKIFYEQTAIPIDRVYTGKMFHALFHMYSAKYFHHNSRILAIHSGGTQGNRR